VSRSQTTKKPEISPIKLEPPVVVVVPNEIRMRY